MITIASCLVNAVWAVRNHTISEYYSQTPPGLWLGLSHGYESATVEEGAVEPVVQACH